MGISLVLKVMGSLLNSCFWISGLMTDELRSFLELNLPKAKEAKKQKFRLGIADTKIGSHIHEVTKIPCESGEFILELFRGVRLHFDRFLKDLKVCISLRSPSALVFICLFFCSRYEIILLLINFLSPPCLQFHSLETWKKPNLVWGTVTVGQKSSSMSTGLTIW